MKHAQENSKPIIINDDVVTIEEIELLVHRNEIQNAFQRLKSLLTKIQEGKSFDEVKQLSLIAITRRNQEYYSRIAKLYVDIILSSKFNVDHDNFITLIGLKAASSTVIATSGFQTTDFALRLLNDQIQNKAYYLNYSPDYIQQCILKILLVYNLDNEVNFDFSIFFNDLPLFATATYFGLLATMVVSSPIADAKRDELLKSAYLLRGRSVASVPLIAHLLSVSYMACSYSSYNKKHDLKIYINAMLVDVIQKMDIDINQAKDKINKKRKKPLILLPLELFNSVHAMYRCYVTVIEALKKYFTVEAIIATGLMDKEAKKCFDRVTEINLNENNFSEIMKIVNRIDPDIIYYPSVGMQLWTIMLSNVRITPVQIMTSGHPATTHSEMIDYIIFEEYYKRPNLHELFSEKIVFVPNQTIPIIKPKNVNEFNPKFNLKPDTIKIAISAKSYKLSKRFIDALSYVQRYSSRQIEFHFFPNEVGVLYEYSKTALLQELKTVYIYPACDYDDYITNLRECDIYASTFPFCGANSTFDCLNLGLAPVVMEDSEEPLSVHDANLIRFLGLSEELIAKDMIEYQDIMLDLINDDEKRVSIGKECMTAMKEKYYADNQQDKSMIFADTVYALMNSNGEKISDNNTIDFEDLKKFL